MLKRSKKINLSLTAKRKCFTSKHMSIQHNMYTGETDHRNSELLTENITSLHQNHSDINLETFDDDSIFDKINLSVDQHIPTVEPDSHSPCQSNSANSSPTNILLECDESLNHGLNYNTSNILFNSVPLPENKFIEENSAYPDSLFCDDKMNSSQVQNSQRFLEDVSRFNSQSSSTDNKVSKKSPTSLFDSKSGKNCVGAQYFVENSHPQKTHLFTNKGNFYGLPDSVQHLIYQHKGINFLYDWQKECLELPAIVQRKNLIYALPTSGGKTLVSEILMLRELICYEKNCIFILPYVSIVQEKVSALSPFAIALNFLVEEYAAGRGACPPIQRRCRKSVYVASIEKGSILIDSLIETERLSEIGLIIVDELHLIGDRGRGAILESLLAKVLFVNANMQIIGMSATIGNLAEMSTFLKADTYTRGFRPIDLKEFIKCGCDILELNFSGQTIEDMFVYRRCVNFKYSESIARADPDHLAGLVSECAPEDSCLLFCPTRKNSENVALLLCRILPKNKFLGHRKSEKRDLMHALVTVCGILSPVLAKTIPFGIAYHHSGLTSDERKFIESAYRLGVLSVICCTSTLAAGVNLPAKRVIIRAPYIGSELLTLSRYKQMVGRAGRAGMGITGESILIVSSKDNLRVAEMLFSPMDKALSSLDFLDAIGLQNLIMSSIGLNIASCRRDLHRLVQMTLLSVQSTLLGKNLDEMILSILRGMFENKVLQLCEKKNSQKTIGYSTSINNRTKNHRDKIIYISKSSTFELTNIGKAAFKAGIHYKRADDVYEELAVAQRHLILSNYLHLIYLVVCFYTQGKGDELFSADAALLFHLYNAADDDTHDVFKVLGLTEAYAVQMAKTLSIQGPLQLRLNRLFKALILVDVLKLVPLPDIATKFYIDRGTLQSLVSQTISAASSMSRFCEHINELWCFAPLFRRISNKMDHCGIAELEPLLGLPAVKTNRAKQLFTSGFRTVEDIATANPSLLVKSVEHMSFKVATEVVAAAKVMVMKRLNDLEEATETLKNFIKPNRKDI